MNTLYAFDFHSLLAREDERTKDWLHGSMTFTAFPTREAALAAARAALEVELADADNYAEDEYPDGLPTITKWSRSDLNGTEVYDDGGVWFETSNGDEGRVVIHTIELGRVHALASADAEQADNLVAPLNDKEMIVVAGWRSDGPDGREAFLRKCQEVWDHPEQSEAIWTAGEPR